MKIRMGKLRQIIREVSESEENLFSANSIRYGHAPLEFVKLAQKPNDHIKEWFIQSGWVSKLQDSAPSNDSEDTKRDLEQLLKLTKNATQKDIAFSEFVDDESNIADLFIKLLA